MAEIIGGCTPRPVPRPVWRDLGDSLFMAGYYHACLTLPDVAPSVAELRRRGVQMFAEPFVLLAAGRKLAFGADSFGNLFKLAEVV